MCACFCGLQFGVHAPHWCFLCPQKDGVCDLNIFDAILADEVKCNIGQHGPRRWGVIYCDVLAEICISHCALCETAAVPSVPAGVQLPGETLIRPPPGPEELNLVVLLLIDC